MDAELLTIMNAVSDLSAVLALFGAFVLGFGSGCHAARVERRGFRMDTPPPFLRRPIVSEPTAGPSTGIPLPERNTVH